MIWLPLRLKIVKFREFDIDFTQGILVDLVFGHFVLAPDLVFS